MEQLANVDGSRPMGQVSRNAASNAGIGSYMYGIAERTKETIDRKPCGCFVVSLRHVLLSAKRGCSQST